MSEGEGKASNPSWLQRWDSLRTSLRAVKSRLASRTTPLDQPENGSVAPSEDVSPEVSPRGPAIRIASYSLVLMDPDGQVVWTREWDSGGVFEFGPRQHLWVFCGFTNHSPREAEISEYEVELMSEDGAVVERFGESFGDFLIIPPGASKQFPAEWRM